MFRFEEKRCTAMRRVDTNLFSPAGYILVMSFLRIKTVKGRKYLYRQTSRRKGKKVLSIMEYICSLGWIGVAMASPGNPGGFSGSRSTNKRTIRHQEEYDRELFATNPARFNAKQRRDYELEQKVRSYAKEGREKKMSREERQEREEARQAANRKAAETMEAVREFKEARDAEKSATTVKGESGGI